MLRAHQGKLAFSEKTYQFVTALIYLIKCLKETKYQRLLLTSAPSSALPSFTTTMVCPNGKQKPLTHLFFRADIEKLLSMQWGKAKKELYRLSVIFFTIFMTKIKKNLSHFWPSTSKNAGNLKIYSLNVIVLFKRIKT